MPLSRRESYAHIRNFTRNHFRYGGDSVAISMQKIARIDGDSTDNNRNLNRQNVA